jgi:quinoprotein glucose dehydrogenase
MTERRSWKRLLLVLAAFLVAAASPVRVQQGAAKGEWRFYGGDAVKDLQIAWRWKAENFGPRPDFNWEVTPIMVDGVLYFTAGSRRDAVAVDAATGETLWMYRLDEGERGTRAVRTNNRGLAYWSDGASDRRILLISPGFQLVALDAKTGRPVAGFGHDGLIDLTEGLDRDVVKPGQIGSSSPAIVIRDTVVVGAAMLSGTAPPSKTMVPGYIRGFDVRTGARRWTFRTVPQQGEFGNETWGNDSWKYTGNLGAWAPLSGDEALGYVYVPLEMPTGDFYGGNRPGDNLFGDSLVCLDARTGRRVWHYQLVHHDIWDYDIPSPPILLDVTVGGRRIRAVAQPTKQGFLYVFDRESGWPVGPIKNGRWQSRPCPESGRRPRNRSRPNRPRSSAKASRWTI